MDIVTTLRQFRIAEFAVFDFAVSYLGVWLLAPLLTRLGRRAGIEIPRASWMFFVLPLAIVFHVAFAQQTPLTRDALSLSGGYGTKGVVLLSLLLGLRGISRIAKKPRT